MHKQNLIHKLIQKILSVNKILMSIKGHNCVENYQKIAYIVYNMDLVYINIYTITETSLYKSNPRFAPNI